jgi:hypothetical protein
VQENRPSKPACIIIAELRSRNMGRFSCKLKPFRVHRIRLSMRRGRMEGYLSGGRLVKGQCFKNADDSPRATPTRNPLLVRILPHSPSPQALFMLASLH